MGRRLTHTITKSCCAIGGSSWSQHIVGTLSSRKCILWVTDMLKCLYATSFAAEQERIYAGLQRNVQFIASHALIKE